MVSTNEVQCRIGDHVVRVPVAPLPLVLGQGELLAVLPEEVRVIEMGVDLMQVAEEFVKALLVGDPGGAVIAQPPFAEADRDSVSLSHPRSEERGSGASAWGQPDREENPMLRLSRLFHPQEPEVLNRTARNLKTACTGRLLLALVVALGPSTVRFAQGSEPPGCRGSGKLTGELGGSAVLESRRPGGGRPHPKNGMCPSRATLVSGR